MWMLEIKGEICPFEDCHMQNDCLNCLDCSDIKIILNIYWRIRKNGQNE